MANLLVDIGNTDTCAAISERGVIKQHVRAITDCDAKSFLEGAPAFECDAAIISCVVPDKDKEWKGAINNACGVEPLFCTYDLAKPYLKFLVDDPSIVGSDRIADCVAAIELYGEPIIVVDFGTATNIEFVNSKREFCGGILMPGVFSGMKGLSYSAAKLSDVRLEKPIDLLGETTEEAIQSGLIYGEAARVDGLIKRIKEKYKNEEGDIKVVATGGFLNLVANECNSIDFTDSTLTLKGLEIILNSSI